MEEKSKRLLSFKRVQEFLEKDLWIHPLKKAEGWRKYAYHMSRALYIASRGFYTDICFLRASALTFYTLMSIVPILAMSFAVAKGFGFQNHLEEMLYQQFAEQKKLIMEVIGFSRNLLAQTKGGLIAGIGIVILFWTVIKVVHHIEDSMNVIWKVHKSRSFARKFSDYFSLMIISPLFFLMASSFTVIVVSRIQKYIGELPLYETVSSLLLFSLKLAPYCLIWTLFTFLYLFIPNTKVRFLSGFCSGIVAGTVYQIVQWGYIYFQIGTSRYNAIYGSFAALPLFLFWVFISWVIFLFGTELAYAFQNVRKYEYNWKSLKKNRRFDLILSLWITHQAINSFHEKERGIIKDEIFELLEIPYSVVEKAFDVLVEEEILLPVKNKEEEYIIAIPYENLRIMDVVDIVEKRDIPFPDLHQKAFYEISNVFDNFREAIIHSDKNQLLKDIK